MLPSDWVTLSPYQLNIEPLLETDTSTSHAKPWLPGHTAPFRHKRQGLTNNRGRAGRGETGQYYRANDQRQYVMSSREYILISFFKVRTHLNLLLEF